MDSIFQLLDAEGLSPKHTKARIWGWSKTRVLHFLEEATSLFPKETTRSSKLFAFHANSSLGGARNYCMELGCRLKEVDRLARFAALYADEVLIQPPVATHHEMEAQSLSDVRTRLHDDVAVLQRLRPLIDENIVKFLPRPAFCQEHWTSVLRETALDSAKRALLKELGSKVQIYSEDLPGYGVGLHFVGPESCLAHGHECITINAKPPFTFGKKRDASGNPVIIGKDRKKLLEGKAWTILHDLVAQELYGKVAGVRYLTNRNLDSVALHATNPRSKQPQSLALQEAFLHELPIPNSAGIIDLLRLRQHEGAAFAVYRDALSAALISASGTQPEHLQELFRDVVQPKLNEIDARVRGANKVLAGKIKSDIVLGAGVVSVALASGFLMPNAAAILAALGGIHFGIDVLRNLNDLLKEPNVARESEFYFLWRVMKHGRG